MKKKLNIKNLVIVILALVFLFSFIRQQQVMNRIEDEMQKQNDELEQLTEENERLQEECNKVNSDEYLEGAAREFNMIKDGEKSTVDDNGDSN